jgi:hypothetical protein
MIPLYNPLSTTPGKQPLPLSVLSLAALLEGRHDWTLIDANIEHTPARRIIELARAAPAGTRMLGVTVMAGPQLEEAVPDCREVKQAVPELPNVWGGYFLTQHADTVLAAPYIDFVVRSQGERPLLDLIEVCRRGGDLSRWARELGRVLRPGGHLIFSDFHVSWAGDGWRRTFADRRGRRYELPYHPRSVDEHRDTLGQCGFAGCEEREIGLESETGDEADAFRRRWGTPPVVVVVHACRCVPTPEPPSNRGM